jgi:hypothetical protein
LVVPSTGATGPRRDEHVLHDVVREVFVDDDPARGW